MTLILQILLFIEDEVRQAFIYFLDDFLQLLTLVVLLYFH